MRTEPQAPLARETSVSISSTVSQHGFHTPIEEDFPTTTSNTFPSRPNSYLQPPTPTSAIMTMSLEGYLEPQRMSFSSPPAMFQRTSLSFEDAYPIFSHSDYHPHHHAFVRSLSHRRQSSFGVTPSWLTKNRRSLSVSSHHTCIVTVYSIFFFFLVFILYHRAACYRISDYYSHDNT